MITVTLGTTPYPFERAIKWLDELIKQRLITEPIFLQHGSTDIKAVEKHSLIEAVRLVAAADLDKKISQSRLVISHAGQGSTRKLAAQNTSFTIIPRFARYGEHVDDHQVRFSEGVEQLGVAVCRDYVGLVDIVKNPPKPLNQNLFSGPRLGDFLAKKYSPIALSR